jgi:hypothetical protein
MSKVSEYRQDAKEYSLRLETSIGGSGKGWVPRTSASRREAPYMQAHMRHRRSPAALELDRLESFSR